MEPRKRVEHLLNQTRRSFHPGSVKEMVDKANQEEQKRRAYETTDCGHKAVVEEGGGLYVPGMFGPLVLFNSPKTGSTLALPENLLTAENVRVKIAESNVKFGV